MKRPRVKPVPTSTPGVHLDAGAPAPRELPEFRATYTSPEHDDPEADAAVVAWLARLLKRRGGDS